MPFITIDPGTVIPSPPPGQGMGLIPRNFQHHPVGSYPYAEPFDNSLIIPESQWDDLIKQQEDEQSSLEHLSRAAGVKSLNQNGQGYCWAYSTTMAVMLTEIKEGKVHVPLSGHMIGCLVKNYRDQGGWNQESLEFAANNGIASQASWPEGSMDRSNDTQIMRTDAQRHRVTEFWDLSDNRATARMQLASLLLLGVPVMIDLNWWGHSVCAIRLMKRNPFTVRIRNSWGDDWSEAGYGDLIDSRAIPDGASAPSVTVGQ